MTLPGNGIFVVQGEMAMLVTAMRRSTRWGSHSFPNEEYDVLMRTFQELKNILNQVEDLRLLDPSTYLSPFLEVIRSKETTGPVTSLALSAIHKFLSYGLIDPTHPSVPATVEDIADAVTRARFVGTDHSSDGVVLMKILQVLRTLMLSPEGALLTDESVCEIMLSCFRICFETRLTELLRRNAEQCLRDMTQLVFFRLPQFPLKAAPLPAPLSLAKRDKGRRRRSGMGTNSLERKSPVEPPSTAPEPGAPPETSKVDTLRLSQDKNLLNEAEITIEPVESKSPVKKHGRHSSMDLTSTASITQLLEKCVNGTEEEGQEIKGEEVKDGEEQPQTDNQQQPQEEPTPQPPQEEPTPQAEVQPQPEVEQEVEDLEPTSSALAEYINPRGVRFTHQESPSLQPYGMACCTELFRFLISLCNPLDAGNTSSMVQLGLSLLATALEVSADALATSPPLLYLVRDPLCRNLLSLLNTERISIFALNLQVFFLLFEALRFHMKFQMEAFFKKIIEIVSSDTTKAIYELKEIHHLALESLCQMFRIPGLCTELYLNYDCDIYCMNIFEEITKLLSKNVVSSSAYNIHSLSLEALMTIIEAIEMNQSREKTDYLPITETPDETVAKYGKSGHVTLELGGCDDVSVISDHVVHDISQYCGSGRHGRHRVNMEVPSEAELDNIRNRKKWVSQGTELFNQKPERGIEFLQEHGVLSTPLDPSEVAVFLRENPDLDKKMIGEYICKRSSRGEDDGPSVLSAFADSFEYGGLRIEQALRLYLETFRLPGEAPLIFLVMEKFAERWHTTNGEPFANTDAAFRLAYAVIMLNMDQHNHNAKKLNVPMTVDDFVKNLRGCNGSGDFDQKMLEEVYHSIKGEEMVMPAERVGPVRDAYLWRVLQRRGTGTGARYVHVHTHAVAHRLFAIVCPPAVTALSAAFERAPPPTQEELEAYNPTGAMGTIGPALAAAAGLERAAALVARLPPEAMTLDSLLLTLAKFTGLLSPPHNNYIAIGVSLGQSLKAQLALRRLCATAARHADAVRQAWRHILEVTATLYVARLLPKCLIEAEDYLAPGGVVSLVRDAARGEAGLLSSLYSYIALGESGGIRAPTPVERALLDAAAACVARCQLPALLVHETKFLPVDSLQELIRAMIAMGTPPDAESLQLNPQLEDITIFFMELLGQTLIQNRDRVSCVWDEAGTYMETITSWGVSHGGNAARRCVTWSLRVCARLMRCAPAAPAALRRLAGLRKLPARLLLPHADIISCGLYELVKTSAQNVHTTEDWNIVFSLLCAAGVGAWPKDNTSGLSSASSRSEGSEDETGRPTSVSSESELSHSPNAQGWILVPNEGPTPPGWDGWGLEGSVGTVSGAALARCSEALSLVVRDVAHVTPYNCRAAVRAVRLFVAAALRPIKKTSKTRESRKSRGRRRAADDSSDEEVDTLDQYHMVSLQLLDLMHTLHSRAEQIFKWWRDEAEGQAEEYDLWEVAWMPLLQGIAQFCTDRRKQVSNSAIAYLQRALLVPGLGSEGVRWEQCFHRVIFPLLARLPMKGPAASRANTIMCKVFLQHLTALSSLPGFSGVWSRVMLAQRALLAATDDPLSEHARESLKNMLLVMDSVRIFSNSSGDGYNELWYSTWETIGEFLPTLKDELFPNAQDTARPASQPAGPLPLPTLLPPNSTPTILPVPNIEPTDLPIAKDLPLGRTDLPIGPYGNFTQNQSPVNLVQNMTSGILTPTPISGMVPIRNQLYDQAGLTSSVLLQPLNEMISTPIGISMQPQIPVLYRGEPHTKNPPIDKTETDTSHRQVLPTLRNSLLDISNQEPSCELYNEYISNPYTEKKDISEKEATIYDPIEIQDPESLEIRNPLTVIEQKSLSENTTPMHKNKAQFGSSDNLKQESSMFNFSSYFGAVNELKGGSEVFDTLMSTQAQEG